MICRFRRSEVPWEVVESKSVDPVPVYYEDDGVFKVLFPCLGVRAECVALDLDILSVGRADTSGTYIFDMKDTQRSRDLRKAVLFARQQLLQVNAKQGFNLLVLER
jgi:hypothetical protein